MVVSRRITGGLLMAVLGALLISSCLPGRKHVQTTVVQVVPAAESDKDNTRPEGTITTAAPPVATDAPSTTKEPQVVSPLPRPVLDANLTPQDVQNALPWPLDVTHVVLAHSDACRSAQRNTQAAWFVDVLSTSQPHQVGWIRLLLKVRGPPGSELLCTGGDALHVRFESKTARVAVKRIIDRGDGLYEAQAFVRLAGEYKICVAVEQSWRWEFEDRHTWVTSHRGLTWLQERRAATHKLSFRIDPNPPDVPDVGNPKRELMCPPKRPIWNVSEGASCVVRVVAGAWQVKENRPPCDGQRLLPGHWRRLSSDSCSEQDGVCTGDLRNLGRDRDQGWIWESDTCRVHLFGRNEAWSLLRGRWILAWGDSTLKQPMCNWIEYFLGVPIFGAFMEDLHQLPKKGRPGFFSYRSFDIRRHPPLIGADAAKNISEDIPDSTRFTMTWAGCPGIAQGPHQCAPSQTAGFNTRTLLDYFSRSSRLPDVIILNHFIWRKPLGDEVQFDSMVLHAMNTILDAYRAAKGTPKEPLGGKAVIVYVSATQPLFTDAHKQCQGSSFPTTHVTDDLALRLETLLNEHYATGEHVTRGFATSKVNKKSDDAPPPKEPRVVDGISPPVPGVAVAILPRVDLTWPFRYTDEYVHFGLHYGSTRGMCFTGLDHRDHYGLDKCLRRTFADTMLMQWWMNLMKAHFS